MAYTLGTPKRYSITSWHRTDTWHTGELDTFWCAGPTDQSPIVLSQDYDADCSLCWLNHGHTLDLHVRRLEEKHAGTLK